MAFEFGEIVQEITGGYMETTFTPGPWKFIDVIGGCVVWAGKRQLLEYSHSPDEENRANARLAASAPDLYAVLEELLYARTDKAETMAFAALAKARGEQ